MRNRSFITPLLRRWHAERAHRPWLPAALVLLALNAAYFAWIRGAAAVDGDRPLPELNAASIVLLTPEEGQQRQALAQAQAAARNKSAPAPDMLVEFEVTPAKEIPPDR
jgi:hypothetical protein